MSRANRWSPAGVGSIEQLIISPASSLSVVRKAAIRSTSCSTAAPESAPTTLPASSTVHPSAGPANTRSPRLRIREHVLDALQTGEIEHVRRQRLVLAHVLRQQRVEPTERNLAQLARLGNVPREAFQCGAPGIPKRDDVALLGLLDGPLGVDRHAANRAVAHHGHDANDKRPLRGYADTLGVADRVPANDAYRDDDQANPAGNAMTIPFPLGRGSGMLLWEHLSTFISLAQTAASSPASSVPAALTKRPGTVPFSEAVLFHALTTPTMNSIENHFNIAKTARICRETRTSNTDL